MEKIIHMNEKVIYALGFFDGVHAGHATLLAACRQLAATHGCRTGAVTFGSHPDTLVLGKTPGLLNTPSDRTLLLRQQGMEAIITLPFDREMMSMAWQDFFDLLLTRYGAAGLVCGEDFRFGFRGAGTAEKLAAACAQAGIPCAVLPRLQIDGIPVSSTHIRSLIEDGKMEIAVKFLGHPHILTGTVVTGRQLGRTIGIPTANLRLPEDLLVPKFGVYACQTAVGGKAYPAVTNIGTRPTVGGHHVTVEAWLPDFSGDLYGQELTLAFYKFLRPEQQFDSLESLREQIRSDAATLRSLFAGK